MPCDIVIVGKQTIKSFKIGNVHTVASEISLVPRNEGFHGRLPFTPEGINTHCNTPFLTVLTHTHHKITRQVHGMSQGTSVHVYMGSYCFDI